MIIALPSGENFRDVGKGFSGLPHHLRIAGAKLKGVAGLPERSSAPDLRLSERHRRSDRAQGNAFTTPSGISTVEAANTWLPEFIQDYNKRFGRAPANAKDLHRSLSEADDLDEILAWREERKVTRNLTLRYDRMMLLLDPTPLARGLAGRTVEVVNYPDGRFAVRHDGVALAFRVFDKIETVAPGAIVENKRLGAALAFARELQASYPPNRRRGDPRRRRPPNNLEAPGMPTKGRPSRKILATNAAE